MRSEQIDSLLIPGSSFLLLKHGLRLRAVQTQRRCFCVPKIYRGRHNQNHCLLVDRGGYRMRYL